MPATVRQLAIVSAYSSDTDGPYEPAGQPTTDFVATFGPTSNARVGFTVEGGLVVRLLNATGSNSIKGTVVRASASTADAFAVNPAGDVQPIGVVYEDGIADGSYAWVVIEGRCQVLLENTTAATVGNWVQPSATAAGRADMTNAAPPGGGIPELDEHTGEIGHCI